MTADAAALLEQLSVAGPTTIETLPDELHPLIFIFRRTRGSRSRSLQGVERHAEVVVTEQLGLEACPIGCVRVRARRHHPFGFPKAAETARA